MTSAPGASSEPLPRARAIEEPSAKRVCREPAARPLPHAEQREVKRGLGLVLDLVVLNGRALLENDLGDRVGEVDVTYPGVGFDDGRLDHRVPRAPSSRMRHDRRAARVGEEYEMDRALRSSCWRIHERAVLRQGRH